MNDDASGGDYAVKALVNKCPVEVNVGGFVGEILGTPRRVPGQNSRVSVAWTLRPFPGHVSGGSVYIRCVVELCDSITDPACSLECGTGAMSKLNIETEVDFSLTVQLPTTLAWPTSCSMSLYTQTFPLAYPTYSSSRPGSESLCREKCEGDSRCGMYRWGPRDRLCGLYHSSLELMARVMGVEEWEMMVLDPGSNMGSKKCEGVIYDHSYCPVYPKHYEGKYIDSKHLIIYVYSYSSLTPTQCQHLCSTYPQCRSVRHWVYTASRTYCHLYSTTITGLVESGKEDEVLTDTASNTSERYCGEVPYDPPFTETTTGTPTETTIPPLDPTGGASMPRPCLPGLTSTFPLSILSLSVIIIVNVIVLFYHHY